MKALLENDELILRVAIRLLKTIFVIQFQFYRWREGHIRPARKQPQRQPAKAPAENQPKVNGPSVVVLPRRFGWLPQYLPEAAIFAEQVRQFLADPEFAALLAQRPQAGKALRPICRMLGVHPIPEILRQKTPNQAPQQLPAVLPETRPPAPSTASISTAPSPQAPSRNGPTPPRF